jgi:hypothetical protein
MFSTCRCLRYHGTTRAPDITWRGSTKPVTPHLWSERAVGEEVSLEPELARQRASSKWTHMTLIVECVIDRPPGPRSGSGSQHFRWRWCRADRIGRLAPGPHTWLAVGHCLVRGSQPITRSVLCRRVQVIVKERLVSSHGGYR